MLIAITLGTFTHLAGYAPWSPHMNAWSGDPVPEHLLRGTTALAATGRARVPGQAVPQLPRARRERRRARPASRQRRRAPHAGPAHSTGDSGRRQHARVREEPASRGDDGAGRVSRDAASARPDAGARRVARRRSWRRARGAASRHHRAESCHTSMLAGLEYAPGSAHGDPPRDGMGVPAPLASSPCLVGERGVGPMRPQLPRRPVF